MAYVGTPRYLGDDITTLASILQGEAGGEGARGMQAVANVIANRASQNFSGYGSALIDQALARKQFQGQANNPGKEAKTIAAQLVGGAIPDVTGGALYYANPADSSAKWARSLNDGNALKIGNHYFTDNAEGKPFASAVGAVNGLASAPANPVQTVNYVPPPFGNQQANFTPLIGGDQAQPQSATPSAVERAPAPPVAAPDANQDPLKAWGVDVSQPAPDQAAAAPEQDILKTWGVDAGEPTPAGDIAKSQSAKPDTRDNVRIDNVIRRSLGLDPLPLPDDPSSTFGQKVGGAIDAAASFAAPVAGFVNNVGRQIATGVPVIGGALNKADAATNALIAPAINPFLSDANKLQGGTFGERYQNSLATQNGQDRQFQTDHPVISTGAQIAGGVGALGGLSTAVPAVGTALGMSGSIGARTLAGGLSGSALGGADAAVRSEGDPEAIKQGAEFGGVLGAVAPAAGAAIGATVNKLFGGQIPERIAQLAQLARDKYGINVGPGQLSTNPTIKFLDSVVNRLPLSGGMAAKEAQQTAFNGAVANSFGESAKEITPEVIDAAKSRIGQVFDSVATRTPTIKADGQLQTDIMKIFNEAQQTLQPSEVTPLRNQLLALVKQYKDGGNAIDGKTYQAITRKGAPLDRLINSTDPNVSYSASQIREAIDGTLERSAPVDALADLRTARTQWKALKTVEPLANKSATGDISPALLMTQAAKQYGGASLGKGADLVDLGRIGQQFLKEAPSSGTSERTMLTNMLLGGAGASGAGMGVMGMAANPGTIPFALGGAVASGIASRGVGTLLRSPMLANKMIQNSLGTGAGANMLLRAAPQGSLPAYQMRKPLELTARPNKLQ